jgi:nucleoside-diphosphate-sugar epimerase
MRVFITGASGWIGSAVVDELLAHDHQVVALARSDASAAALEAKGVVVRRGDLDDLEALRSGAEDAEGVVNLANKHDWSNPAASNAAERASVQTFLDVLSGSDRPLVIAAGVAGLAQGRPSTEEDRSTAHGPDSPRGGAENLALEHADRVRVVSARFAPTTHGHGDHGFTSLIADAARRQGVSAYLGDGTHAWSAVHRTDAARLVRLGLEQAPTGTILHAVAEEAVATRAIAEALGRALGLPVESVPVEQAVDHFGFVGRFFAMDLRSSSALTQQRFGWTPTGPGLVEDIDAGGYTEPVSRG